MPKKNISKSVIKRLPIYLRILDQLLERDIELISSKQLSKESGFTAEQIRKDLAYFGAFGTRGAGYNTSFLRDRIINIIGLDKTINTVIFGAGHLGTAFTRYNAAKNSYINIAAVFDRDARLVGKKIDDIRIYPIDEAAEFLEQNRIKVAIIAVPAGDAQGVADLLIAHGVVAIMNFAPIKLKVPSGVYVHNADLTLELQSIIYYSSEEEERKKRLRKDNGKDKSSKLLIE
ncbi:MAG: redox-sensing transcriptional repressor Rex [Bacillota bacterium]|nr:redox-sensing transcriptional repressor Rex [Bacillota bacterium]